MAKLNTYHLKCRKCPATFTRTWTNEEFDKRAFEDSHQPGIKCFRCGFPGMAVEVSNRSIRDTFQPGFNRTLNMHFRTYKQYQDELKRRGMIEMGNEDFPEEPEYTPNHWSDKLIKKCVKNGLKLSDRQFDALKAGKKISNEKKLAHDLKKMDEASRKDQ